jgi:hypothetical protein
MKTPRKEAGEPAQWTVYKVRRYKLVWLGSLEALNEEQAREKAYKQLDIRPADRFRISVRRE